MSKQKDGRGSKYTDEFKRRLVAESHGDGVSVPMVSRRHGVPANWIFAWRGDVLVGGMSLLKAFEGGEVWIGDVLFMTAALCWSAYSVTVRRYGLDAV